MATKSDLKIFIVGPVGSGKTVFSCMLNRYVSKHREYGVQHKAGDWRTKAHFAEIESALNGQSWPAGTARGTLTQLNWEWTFRGHQANFILVDPPGEDIESELRGESDKLQILRNIQKSDVLFILIDLHEHQGESPRKKTQNAWILENVLKHAGRVQRIVIGVSKGDSMTHLLARESWGDKTKLMQLISQMMPEFNIAGYKLQIDDLRVHMVMFSAVQATEAYLDDQSLLRKRPCLPLNSDGLDIFVNTITDAYKDRRWGEQCAAVRNWAMKVLFSKVFWIVGGSLVAIYFAYWFIQSAS